MSSRPTSSAEEKGEIMIYQTDDGLTHIDVRMEDETVWLTQAQLCELYQTSKSNNTEFYLKLTDAPINLAEQQVYVALVNLSDYFKFITSPTGELPRHIFESNVRDYQGHVTVNKAIQDSLEAAEGEDFWWLNNGVTIIASSATFSTAKTLKIDFPEVVNGLQTSNEIFNYFSRKALQRISTSFRTACMNELDFAPTFSAGVAEFSTENITGMSVDAIITKADESLYASKKARKNRVTASGINRTFKL